MFTGLVEGIGELWHMRKQGEECRFKFRTPFNAGKLRDGESIAVNGVCLSVEKRDAETFSAFASAETLSRSNLGYLAVGSRVNMERALAFGERLGGHLVTGHVDCLATVREKRLVGQSWRLTFTFPPEYGELVIPKGSVALDGVSLTVNVCGPDSLEVNIIPDTRQRAAIDLWIPGYRANMETDLIGKYLKGVSRPWAAAEMERGKGGLDRDFLGRHGFLK